MANAELTIKRKGFGSTLRTDNWWLSPLLVLLGLSAFVIYSSWAAFQASHYWIGGAEHGFGGYLSPVYSPVLFTSPEGYAGAVTSVGHGHGWFGTWPSWWPSFLPPSPSFFILVLPGLFRFTCYYYRGAYYKAFAGSPANCAVGSIKYKKYAGETKFLIFQNLHRFALYAAIIYIPILGYDAYMSFFRDGVLGIGVGSIFMLANPIFLGLYTFGCHSFRHLIGGKSNCFGCSAGGKMRYGAWKKVSWMNKHHKVFAWASLFSVGLTDVYVRLVSTGYLTDLNTWG